MINYYKVIGVNQDASLNSIKNAYLLKVKKYHPDIYKGDKTFAEQKMIELNEAYDYLKNEQNRAILDDFLRKNTQKPKNNQKKLKFKQFFNNIFTKIKTVFKPKNDNKVKKEKIKNSKKEQKVNSVNYKKTTKSNFKTIKKDKKINKKDKDLTTEEKELLKETKKLNFMILITFLSIIVVLLLLTF